MSAICFVSVAVGCNALSQVQKLIVPLQVTDKQWILYGNSRLKVDQYHNKLTSYLPLRGFHGDIVKITGPMLKEQKMFYTNLFLAGRRASALGATGDDVVFPPLDVSPPGRWVLLAGMVAIFLLLCCSIYRLTLSQWFKRRVEPVATLVPVQVTITMKYVLLLLHIRTSCVEFITLVTT